MTYLNRLCIHCSHLLPLSLNAMPRFNFGIPESCLLRNACEIRLHSILVETEKLLVRIVERCLRIRVHYVCCEVSPP